MAESLFNLLESAARRFPSRPAIVFGDSTLTYAALHKRAARVGAMLSAHGIGPGVRVAFCFRKSVEALVGMFGMIRTGATYVPLDPAWPAERMATIARCAGIRHWIGTKPPREVPGIECAIAVEPEGDAIPLASAEACAPMTGEVPEPERGLANILFTSGSTGLPKGVEITTRSLLHFSQWVVDFFGLDENDRLANHAPFTFDLSTLDIFAAVRAGAVMCPVPERLKMFPYKLAEFIAAAGITTWYSVPSALALLAQRGSLGEHDLSRLRHVIFAGEVMPKALLVDIAGALPDATLTNLYGPTETNVCTFHRVSKEELATDEAVPIGRPISETRAWIVDESGKPLPAGTKRGASIQIAGKSEAETGHEAPVENRCHSGGELWIAGPTVTTGYYGDAEQTAARLVAAPDGAGQAYRTGDRVTVRADGAMMFEGRIDRMIKRGGHRVEPGEIESVLGRHPSVGEAAVVPLADATFGSRLKACVAARDGFVVVESALVAYCRASLPSYMMPDVWEFHAALPRTDRGKIDLQKLMH